jgi:hypothetical protein
MTIAENGSFTEDHYVPIMKWRQGEYQALLRLTDDVKDQVTPLFEVPTEPWDFELEEASKSLDDHLSQFGSRLLSKWGPRLFFLDSCYLDGNAVLADGTHHLTSLFNDFRARQVTGIPVVGLSRTPMYKAAVRDIQVQDGRGMCLRLESSDINSSLHVNIAQLLEDTAANIQDTHLVIDLGAEIAGGAENTALLWQGMLSRVPSLSTWKTVTVAACAFPATLPAATYRPHGLCPRTEWAAYCALINSGFTPRLVNFGDYTVSHPNTEMMDPRMMDPNAKIKYALDDDWLIITGQQVKRFGREQYRDLCDRLIHSGHFAGPGFSWGDAYIVECAAGGSTGGTSTWPSVANNHHITVVVRRLANLTGL